MYFFGNRLHLRHRTCAGCRELSFLVTAVTGFVPQCYENMAGPIARLCMAYITA